MDNQLHVKKLTYKLIALPQQTYDYECRCLYVDERLTQI